MEEILGQDHRQGRADEQNGQAPEGDDVEGHSVLPSVLAGASALACSAGAALGGVCMSRSPLPVAHDGSNCSPMVCSRSLSRSSSRRSLVAGSKDFIMMMASVGHTCTHSSQNSHA